MNQAILDILIFAVIAVFLFFKLRNVLGEVSDEDKNSTKPSVKPKSQNIGRTSSAEKLARLNPQAGPGEWPTTLPDFKLVTNATAHNALLQLHTVTPSFDPHHFLQGAERAFPMIIDAFSKGDKKTLESLLSENLYKDYAKAIDTREKNGETWDSEVVEMTTALISDADISDQIATITVDFETIEKTTVRDKEGNFIDEQDGQSEKSKNCWSFEKDLKSKQHIWTLTDTQPIGDK